MAADNETFFENLARGGNAGDDDGSVTDGGAIDDPTNGTEMPQEETYEVKLAKASASALSARRKTAVQKTDRGEQDEQPHEREAAWDDSEPEGQLTVDVYQTPDDIVVESAIAGVKPDDIDVNVTADSISIKGARYHEQKVSDENYFHQECYWGRFARSIILPQEVDPENADVSFKNGILTVRLPKVNKKKTRRLKVRID